jgi:hypothetical protein
MVPVAEMRGACAQEWLAREEVKARAQLETRQLRKQMLDSSDDAPSVAASDRYAAAAAVATSASGRAGLASNGRGHAGSGSTTPGGYSVASGFSGYRGGDGGFAIPEGGLLAGGGEGSSRLTGPMFTF